MKILFFAESVFPEIKESFSKIDAPFWEKYWHWLLAIILVLIIIGSIIYLLKPKPKLLSPYELAKLALDKLASSQLDDEAFANSLSKIARDYLEAEYSLPAPERTTEEFLIIASSSNVLDDEVEEKLSNLLKLSDMAKFAKYSLDENQRAEILSGAYDLIETSNKIEQEKAKEELSKEKEAQK